MVITVFQSLEYIQIHKNTLLFRLLVIKNFRLQAAPSQNSRLLWSMIMYIWNRKFMQLNDKNLVNTFYDKFVTAKDYQSNI